MKWEIRSDRPVYSQLMEQIQQGIICGEYPLGGKLPSVRDMAAEAGVNPNTMQKALSELERTGLLYSQRTSGRFVTEDEEKIVMMKETLAKQQMKEFLKQMRQLGFSLKEICDMIQQLEEEMES
ncbi:MAG: GntR family transcriptional regulator [Firmicutes bacterium]|uniref:GntR family transcriptional regulator n=1 Tax=Candidatus Scybalomonas excrementavium TaxID=2840943 RepID=A0A9D9HYW2_9FIRM|nr:GntR family transcriptional regulator [Candidatus Scybalomonas excrementavium]